MAVKVHLLGPPRVERDGVVVAFDTRKALALLAYLVVAAHARPRDTVAELLWPDHDAEHARGALRRTLSTLRSGIGAELVEAGRERIAVVRGPGMWVDVDAFRACVSTGSFGEAAAVFGGEFLDGFGLRDAPGFESWQRGVADELRRELGVALGGAVERSEARGDVVEALGHARRRVALDPLGEPAHRALIRLLARTGDRAAALAQYRECVRALSRELGVPPLEETTRLYEAISAGTIELEGPERAPVPAEGRAVPLVGRDAQRRALMELWGAAASSGKVAMVEGEAGIGKTRLVEEVLGLVRERGGVVLSARAYEEEAGLAYGPVVAALRDRVASDGAWTATLPPRALGDAARLLPELGEPSPPLDGPLARAQLVEGVWTTLTAAVAGPVPGVLFVDDAQWADESTLALLAYGLRRLSGRPMLVVLAWRTPGDHPLRRIVAGAERDGGGLVQVLSRLSAADTSALVGAARPDAGEAFAGRLHAATEGLPFLLVEFLRIGDAGAGWSLPAGAREVLRARLASGSETARQVLAAAAVIGRSFGVDTVRAVSGRGDEESVAALEELVGRGLIREGDAEYDFTHEQLRALVYEETSLARRRLLHGRAADAGGAPAATLARHLRLAGREAEAALEYARAADEAIRVFASAEALEHLRAALALGHPEPGALWASVGDLQTLAGDYAAAIAAYETAAASSPPGDLASIEHRLGHVHQRRGDGALAVARLEAALEATGEADHAARSTISADLGLTLHEMGQSARALAFARAARDLADRADDDQARGKAFNLLGMLAAAAGEAGEAVRCLERSLALADRADDARGRVAALNNLALVRRSRGELDAALDLTRAALALCGAHGDRHREAALHNNVADILNAAGRRDEAMEELKRAVAIFAEVGAELGSQPAVWSLSRW